jgi:hypothetical protein
MIHAAAAAASSCHSIQCISFWDLSLSLSCCACCYGWHALPMMEQGCWEVSMCGLLEQLPHGMCFMGHGIMMCCMGQCMCFVGQIHLTNASLHHANNNNQSL